MKITVKWHNVTSAEVMVTNGTNIVYDNNVKSPDKSDESTIRWWQRPFTSKKSAGRQRIYC